VEPVNWQQSQQHQQACSIKAAASGGASVPDFTRRMEQEKSECNSQPITMATTSTSCSRGSGISFGTVQQVVLAITAANTKISI